MNSWRLWISIRAAAGSEPPFRGSPESVGVRSHLLPGSRPQPPKEWIDFRVKPSVHRDTGERWR